MKLHHLNGLTEASTRNLRHLRTVSIVAAFAATAACGSDSTSPQSPLVGSYTAFQWVTTGGSGQTNQLTIGSTLQITLNADGSTSGHMHIAASNGGPATDLDFDMAGTWSESNNVVDFTQAADTFVRDMTFAVQPIANGVVDLVADQVFSGTRIQLTLRHGA
jgi:hypothetical protein